MVYVVKEQVTAGDCRDLPRHGRRVKRRAIELVDWEAIGFSPLTAVCMGYNICTIIGCIPHNLVSFLT